MRVEDRLKGMMRIYATEYFKTGIGREETSEIPASDMLVYCTVAVAKLVDCDFSAMSCFENRMCVYMYQTVKPTAIPPSVAKDLQSVYDIILGLSIAFSNTPNWPTV
eukprot:Phypoly_transcript_11872.p3 GENE.Phypoly_transcript_11872~~Phypoly_transcript_11872.p3  ORF type:complete len:107 (+),score=11.59 Phypoly_transcript_11872:637-957(+)